MSERTVMIDGVRVPRLLYGTAWKEDETERLTALALRQGFRGIDTANQRKHYHEAAVGSAVGGAIRAGLVARADLFLQTKFTFRGGQDHRLPYDPDAPVSVQVGQSFESSLRHLGVSDVDSLVLHSPFGRVGLGPATGRCGGRWKRSATRPGLPLDQQRRRPAPGAVCRGRVRPGSFRTGAAAAAGTRGRSVRPKTA